jgi:fructokinase
LKLLTIGEILWDVFDDFETLGGAPLNFSVTAQRLGNQVKLITGVGKDLRGQRAVDSMNALHLPIDFVQVLPGADTGTARVTVDDSGNASFLIKRPAAFDYVQIDDQSLLAIAAMDPEWLYFGTLAQFNPPTEQIVGEILRHFRSIKCFYDVNLRDNHWNLALVQRLSNLASVLKLNADEAETLFHLTHPSGEFSLERFCQHWARTYNLTTICITLGAKGCAVFEGNVLQYFRGLKVEVVDTVGAGDAFAAAFLHGRELNWPMERTASFANALGALVASRSGATPDWTTAECWCFLETNGPSESNSTLGSDARQY